MTTADRFPLEVGARVRALRHEAGLSQSKFANILGMTPGAIGNWEQGQGYPMVKRGMQICEKFNVTLDYIYRGQINQLEPGRATLLAELEGLKHDPSGPNLGLRHR